MVLRWDNRTTQMVKVDCQPMHRQVFATIDGFRQAMFSPERNRGKLYTKCCICGWDDGAVDLAHIVPLKSGGKFSLDNIAPLCPNHHRLFDRKKFTDGQKMVLYNWMTENQED